MNRTIVIAVIAIIVAAFGVYFLAKARTPAQDMPATSQTDAAEEQIVRARISEFGTKFKNVSLLGASEAVRGEMEVQYKPYVTSELLAQWESNPAIAPGRQTSNPYPDHVAIDSLEKQTDGSYRAIVNVVEVTSDKPNETAALQPIYMRLRNQGGQWLVVELQKNPYTEN